MICTLTGAQHLGSKSMWCLTSLCAAARPHTVGKIISTPRLCQGRSAFVIDGIPFSLFLLFPLSLHIHTHTQAHQRRNTAWAHCISEIQSLAPLWADVSKNPILLFYCVSGDRGPSLRAQGHRTHQHKEPYLPLSVRVWKCALSLSIYLPASLSLTHTHTHTHTLYLCRSHSLLFIHSTSHEQTAPSMPWPQIRWNSHNSLPDYKISGLSIWTQWLRASIYQDVESVASWSHC